MKKITVHIIDDSASVRVVLTELLNTDPEIEVVGTSSDPIIAKRKLEQCWHNKVGMMHAVIGGYGCLYYVWRVNYEQNETIQVHSYKNGHIRSYITRSDGDVFRHCHR